ncbi:class I SAM-dependent methyltransferase [Schlesneria sp.]|uniref:class I SAM-dependent methyltransferase n=1 Tax=Schlesneria sp. TaxID=2762018 RepID=UPI002F0768F7
MSNDIAATIAVGSEYRRLAEISVDRMREATGREVVVLGEEELANSGLRNASQLKFRLFDLVDAENVLYFDADVFALARWDLQPLCDTRKFYAMRAFWFDEHCQKLGSIYGFDDRVVCSGLFVANRTHHAAAFRLAEKLQPPDDQFHGFRNLEEIAISIALNTLSVPIHFLPRRFNWVQYGRGNLFQQANVVMAHACDAALRRQFLTRDWQPVRDFYPDVSATKFESDRTFIYDRVGYDLRPLTLRTDGTVGSTGGNAERYWFLSRVDGEEVLTIGSVLDETCSFRRGRDGIWRGRWVVGERMPTTLSVHRAQVVIDLISARFGGTSLPLMGVEVGVFRGETSALLLQGLSGLHLWKVDPWRIAQAESDYWLTNAGDATMSQAMFDEALEMASSATRFASERRQIVPCPSITGAEIAPDNLDFIFIDGDHSYTGLNADLVAWWPKLRPGGIFCGHDYGNANFPDVKIAVDEFAHQHGLQVGVGSDLVWYFTE